MENNIPAQQSPKPTNQNPNITLKRATKINDNIPDILPSPEAPVQEASKKNSKMGEIFGVYSKNNQNAPIELKSKPSSQTPSSDEESTSSANSSSQPLMLNTIPNPNDPNAQEPQKPKFLSIIQETEDYESKIPQTKGDFYSDLNLIRRNCGIMKSESIRDVAKAGFDSCDSNKTGLLVLTDYRLYFKFEKEEIEQSYNFSEDYLKIPVFHITKVSRIQDNVMSYDAYPMEINLRDTRTFKFHIYEKPFVFKFFNILNNIISLEGINRAPQYHFTTSYRKFAEKQDGKKFFNGWDIYDPESEYIRQGITEVNDLGLRYCHANEGYKLCQTYPEFLVFPKQMTDEKLMIASKYRTKNRLPVLSYYYNGNEAKNRENFKKTGKLVIPSIWRSSQNKAGLTGQKKNEMDQELMDCMKNLSTELHIFDARPKINALVNRLNGGGYENTEHYNDTQLKFCYIDNIHAARKCLRDFFKICLDDQIVDNSHFWSSIEGTGWYQFVYKILKFSSEISQTLQDNHTVLIHCSDGWDRSAQLITMSQMLIDPYFRTFKGLAVLIEKDWLSFGHQFGLRNGIYWKQVGEDQRSPIFLQWLDCLHQLLHQFPNAFEYNNELLLFFAKTYTANIYGTFMFNSDLERDERKAKELTMSVWTDVYKNLDKYKNLYYNPENPVKILKPNVAPYKLRFWREYFMEYNAFFVKYNTFYLSDKDESVSFTSNRMFYEYHKKMDVTKFLNLEVKQEDLVKILYDVYLKTKDKPEVLDKLQVKTRNYLKDLLNKPKMKEILMEEERKKKEIEDKKKQEEAKKLREAKKQEEKKNEETKKEDIQKEESMTTLNDLIGK